jgi:hypothetical protein
MADFRRFEKAFEQAMREVSSPDAMRGYATVAAEMIRTRTRLGYGVPENLAERRKLKPLSERYVERRRQLAERGELSGDTTAKRSNLTLTGQMLDSIRPLSAREGEARVGPQGGRNDGLSNEDVGKYVTDAGRPFNFLSEVEYRRLVDVVRRRLDAAISRYLTK